MVTATMIQQNMEVLGSDGDLVGIVDHVERTGGVIVTKDDPMGGGRPISIPLAWVFHVECKVHLRQPAAQAKADLVRH